jgi:outer membrane protein assembly factor BamE (lipoprotein component of BamABCDE complex)
MRSLLHVAFVGVLVTASACALFAPRQSLYLKSAQDRATQDEVRQRLGAPHSTAINQSGESVWLYEVRELEPGSQNSWASMGSWCDQYTLRFDKSGVLREWTHESFLHGGENMPATCNASLGVQKPAL